MMMSDDTNDDDFLDNPDVIHSPQANLIRVKKGEEINITRRDPAIRQIMVGIGWDLKRFEGDPLDLDASLFLLDKNDKTREDEDFVFYNNLAGRDGAARHLGDSRTGAGDGDDESMIVDLMALPFEVVKIAFVLSIYDLDLNSNNFSMVKNVYFRIVNQETNHETFRYELDGELGSTTALHIGYLERIGSDWVFTAVGEPIHGGLAKIATDYGMIITQNIRS